MVNKEIYDRIVKNEMDRATRKQGYDSMERRQRMITDAGVEKYKINQQTERYKANEKRRSDMYGSYIDGQVDLEKARLDNDEAMIRESVGMLQVLEDFLTQNPITIPRKIGKGTKAKYQLPDGDGGWNEITEQEYNNIKMRNDQINDAVDVIVSDYKKLSGNLKIDGLSNDQLKRAKSQLSKANPNFMVDKQGQIRTNDGRTLSELSRDYLSNSRNDKVSNADAQPDFNKVPKPMDSGRPDGSVMENAKAPRDLNAPKKGGIHSGANQGVNTGKSFRQSVKDNN